MPEIITGVYCRSLSNKICCICLIQSLGHQILLPIMPLHTTHKWNSHRSTSITCTGTPSTRYICEQSQKKVWMYNTFQGSSPLRRNLSYGDDQIKASSQIQQSCCLQTSSILQLRDMKSTCYKVKGYLGFLC